MRLSGILVSASLIICCVGCSHPGTTVRQQAFGTLSSGGEAHLYTITNTRGATLTLTDYGARIVGISVPDRYGRIDDVVLGYGNLASFEKGDRFMGCTIGRYANRIDGAAFELDRFPWDAVPLQETDRAGVRFTRLSPSTLLRPGEEYHSVTEWHFYAK